MNTKQMLVLARNDPLEAMRVAAGLTIFGHNVQLVLMNRALTDAQADSEQAELLELTEIVPLTTVPAMSEYFEVLSAQQLANAIDNADAVVNL